MKAWTSTEIRVTFKLDGKEAFNQYLLFETKDTDALAVGIRYFEDDHKDDGAEIIKVEITEKHTYPNEED